MTDASSLAVDAVLDPANAKPRRSPLPAAERGLFDIVGFADWAGISRTQAFKEIRAKRLSPVYVGRLLRIPRANAEAWRDALPNSRKKTV